MIKNKNNNWIIQFQIWSQISRQFRLRTVSLVRLLRQIDWSLEGESAKALGIRFLPLTHSLSLSLTHTHTHTNTPTHNSLKLASLFFYRSNRRKKNANKKVKQNKNHRCCKLAYFRSNHETKSNPLPKKCLLYFPFSTLD